MLEPSNAELAERLGLKFRAERMAYELLILGGGPAGLSAALYAAREGMDALAIESGALGGQAGATDRIDNDPGFPDGVSGAELAGRLIAHARRYGVELLSAVEITGVRREPDCILVTTAGGEAYAGKAAIVATGSRYRRLGIPGEEGLIGLGVHYCATCDGPFYRGAAEVAVIGGGNSALEESLFLATLADRVTILTRGELRASELVQDKIRNHPRITVHTGVDLDAFERREDGRLGAIVAHDRASGAALRVEPAAAFVFVGLDRDPRSRCARRPARGSPRCSRSGAGWKAGTRWRSRRWRRRRPDGGAAQDSCGLGPRTPEGQQGASKIGREPRRVRNATVSRGAAPRGLRRRRLPGFG